MIILPRKTPEQIHFYEVLLRRGQLNDQEKRELERQYVNVRAGYVGERRVDREWKEVNVEGMLFHDFTCLNEFGHTHQIDTIFVCKHFILIVEIKNVAGQIDFDDRTRQLIRTRQDGRLEAFNSPIDQVKRHRELLERQSIHWEDYVPIESAIIIANPYTVIGKISDETLIFNVSGLRTKVYELVNQYRDIQLNTRKIEEYLKHMYKPLKRAVRQGKLPLIRTGVFCGECGEVMLHRKKGYYCLSCSTYDKDDIALRQALNDYRVLYGGEISNSSFRNFVGLKSADTAYSMLRRVLTEQKGLNKGRVYIIPENILTL